MLKAALAAHHGYHRTGNKLDGELHAAQHRQQASIVTSSSTKANTLSLDYEGILQ